MIVLHRLTIENFKSFKKPTIVDFNEAPGFKLLCGDNQVNPRMGSNGSGKSSLWDALIFCLYGTSAKGHKAADLASWGGGKRAAVTALLCIDGQNITVARRGSPNELLVNGRPATQEEVDYFFLSRARFQHAVIFGQGVPLFLDLSVPERGALFDEILELEIWNAASEHTGRALRKLSAEAETHRRAIAAIQGRIEAYLSTEADAAARAGEWEAQYLAALDAAAARLDAAEAKLAEAVAARNEWKARPRPSEDPRQKEAADLRAELKAEAAGYVRDIRAADAKLALFAAGEADCDTCGQHISGAYAKKTASELARKQGQLSVARADAERAADDLAEEISRLVHAHREAVDAWGEHNGQMLALDGAVRWAQSMVDAAQQAAEALANADTNPHEEAAAKAAGKRAAAEQELERETVTLGHVEAAVIIAEYWKDGFKKLRLKIIQEALALLELEATNAAQLLGLTGWQITCSTETETRSGGTKLGINVQVKAPEIGGAWGTWSGGESQRVRLAVSLGLSSMIQKRAGMSYGFEVWDEPSAWLSAEGIEDLLDSLRRRGADLGKSVWLLDHRALMQAGFDEVWTARKTTEGTSIVPGI